MMSLSRRNRTSTFVAHRKRADTPTAGSPLAGPSVRLRTAAAVAALAVAVGGAPVAAGEGDGAEDSAGDSLSEELDRGSGLADDVVPDPAPGDAGDPYDQNRADELTGDREEDRKQDRERTREQIKDATTEAYLDAGDELSGVGKDPEPSEEDGDGGDEEAGTEGETSGGKKDTAGGDERSDDGPSKVADISPSPVAKPDVPAGFERDGSDNAGLRRVAGRQWLESLGPAPGDILGASLAAEMAGRFVDTIPGAAGAEGGLGRYAGMPGAHGEGGVGAVGRGFGGIFGGLAGTEAPGWDDMLGRRAWWAGQHSGTTAGNSSERRTNVDKPGDQWGVDTKGEYQVVMGIIAIGTGAAGMTYTAAAASAAALAPDAVDAAGDDGADQSGCQCPHEQSEQASKAEGEDESSSKKKKSSENESSKEKEKSESQSSSSNNENESENENQENESASNKEDESESSSNEEDESEKAEGDGTTLPAPDQRGPGGPMTEEERELLARFDDTSEDIEGAASHEGTTMPSEPGGMNFEDLNIPGLDWYPSKTAMPVRPREGMYMMPLPASVFNPGTIDPHRGN